MKNELLLSNSQLVFLYEKLYRQYRLLSLKSERQRQAALYKEEKLALIKDPVLHEVSRVCLERALEQRFKATFPDAIADFAGPKDQHMIIDILTVLSIPYYAITGQSDDDLEERLHTDIIYSEFVAAMDVV